MEGDVETERLSAWLLAIFEAKTGVDLRRADENAAARVREAAEKGRNEWRVTAPDSGLAINLPFLSSTDAGPLHMDERIAPGELRRILAGDPMTEELEAARYARAGKPLRELEPKFSGEATEGMSTKTAVILMAVLIVALLAWGAASAARKESQRHHHADRHHEGEHAR